MPLDDRENLEAIREAKRGGGQTFSCGTAEVFNRILEPEVEFARVLAREGDATLSVCVDGKSYMWAISKDRVLALIESGAAALRDLK